MDIIWIRIYFFEFDMKNSNNYKTGIGVVLDRRE